MAVSSIAFKGGEVPSTPTVEPASQKPQKLSLAEEEPKDSVSFCGKQHKKEVQCEKTHFGSFLGAIGGAVIGIGAAVGSKIMKSHSEEEVLLNTKGKAALFGVGATLLGLIVGKLGDTFVNKTVKNTTQSVIDNLD